MSPIGYRYQDGIIYTVRLKKMIPIVAVVAIVATIEICLWIGRRSTMRKAERFVALFNKRLQVFHETYGTRANARNFIAEIIDHANEKSEFRRGGFGAMGNRIEQGDFIGAGAVFLAKATIEGAGSLIGKASKALFRSTRAAVAKDPPKSQEQEDLEASIREQLSTLFDLRNQLKTYKGWMIGIVYIWIFAMLAVAVSYSN